MQQAKLGVIDTLSAGFTTVIKNPWILVVPIMLDLFLWWGPRLSPSPLFRPALTFLALPPEVRAQYLEALQGLDLRETIIAAALGLPSFVSRGEVATFFPSPTPIELSDPLQIFGTTIALALFGLLIAAIYLSVIAFGVRKNIPRSWLQQILVWVGGVTSFGIMLFLASLAIGLPMGMALFIFTLLSPQLSAFLILLVLLLLAVISLYLFFSIPAILMSDAGPIPAIIRSIALVRNHFWPALGLVLATSLLSTGIPLALRYLSRNPLGTILGILGTAYVGSGVIAASLIFYHDRTNIRDKNARQTQS